MSDLPADFNIPYLPVRRFAAATNASAATVRRLLNAGRLSAVKNGKATLIVQSPASYLGTLPPYRPGTMRPGPGRGKRGPMARCTSGEPA